MYSHAVGKELQRIVDIEEQTKKKELNHEVLTHTFCGILANFAHV